MYLLTSMRVIAGLLFPETPAVAWGEAKGNSWCQEEQ